MQSLTNRISKYCMVLIAPVALLVGYVLSIGQTGVATAATNRIERDKIDREVFHGTIGIVQSGTPTETLWSVIVNSWIRLHPSPPGPPGPLSFHSSDICSDGRSLKIGTWAVSSERALQLSSSMNSVGYTPLVVANCSSNAFRGLPNIIDPEGNMERLVPVADKEWIFVTEIDSTLGDYELEFPDDDQIRDLVVPMTLDSGGRVYTTPKEAENLVRRFKSITDVGLLGDGFYGIDRLLANLVKVDEEGPIPLHAWEIPIGDAGSFVSAVPNLPDSVYNQENATGQFAVILCEPESCDLAPSFVQDPQGQVSVVWPTLYSTAFCVGSAYCSVEPSMDVLVNDGSYWTAPVGPGLSPEQGSPSLDLTDDLSIEILANDPLVGAKNGSGIQHVDFSILDEKGKQVYQWRDDVAPFCLFGDTDICTPPWNWDPLPPGTYDVNAWVVTPDGFATEATDSPLQLLVR